MSFLPHYFFLLQIFLWYTIELNHMKFFSVEENAYLNETIEINLPQTDVNVSEDVSKRNEFW